VAILGPNALKFSSRSPEQTFRYGLRLGQLLQDGDILLLEGNLGAGKTLLTSGISRGWGAVQSATSPTYLLVNEYSRPDGKIFHHLDCYRLGNFPDVESINLAERLAMNGVLLVEWPQVILPWLPADHLLITLAIMGDDRREIQCEAKGARSAQLLTAFRRLTFER